MNPNPWTEDLFRAAFGTAPTAVGLADSQDRLLAVNAAFAAWLGRPSSDLTGRKLQDLLRPNPDAWGCGRRPSPDLGPTSNQRHPFLRADGAIVWGWVSRVPYENRVDDDVCALVHVIDVSCQEAIERQLRDKDRRYELATRAGRTGFWEWNAETDSTYADSIIKEFLGFSDEFGDQGHEWNSRIHPDDIDWLMALRQDHLEGRTPIFQAELRFLHKDGSVRWLLVRGTLLRNEQGQPQRMIGTSTDITERRALERQLLEITAGAQRRVGEALHDQLGQVLTGLAFLARNLGDQLSADAHPAAAAAARISAGLSQALKHVQLLARGLIPVEIHREGLSDALAELVERTRAFNVDCVFQCDRPVLLADSEVATQLYHITQEAVANAIRHASAKRIQVALSCEEGVHRVTISDDGCGGHPFDPTRGMGLRIMRHRAGLIGARVDIRAGDAGGTVVTCSARGDRAYGQAHNDVSGSKEDSGG